MKKFIYIILAVLTIAGVSSCKDQDDIYQQWVKKGGYTYPEKSTDLKAYDGYNRIKLQWAYPKDPSVTSAKITWANGTKSLDVNYSDYVGKDTIVIYIDNLEERSYTFDIVNFDAAGNKSMTTEITTSPYAENWLLTHSEREIISADVQSDGSALVKTGFGTDEMIATRFRYLNNAGDTITLTETLPAASSTISFPDAAPGKKFEYSSSYCPAEGLDTIWNAWRRSPNPIAGKLDCSGWVATCNTVATRPTSNLFDGVIGSDVNHAWWSYDMTTFPKILVIDTQSSTYMINKLLLYQNEAGGYTYRTNYNVEVYFGNQLFDINAGTDYANTDPFKNAVYSKSLVFWNGTSWAGVWLPEMENVRYIAIVFKDSRRNGNALFEVEAYGYDTSKD